MTAVDAVEVTLFGRPTCHLCEQAEAALTPLTERLGARLVHVNVEADPELDARFGLAIPVVLVDGTEVTRAPIDVSAVRSAIVAAAARDTKDGRAASN
ncbi:MAG: glutaredoxin family protein [Chloroflexi bacterium]|nr:glutaredoxin family protein [Chloroflexota bacterium]MDA1003631.1 glutaredoxin family protein [Chloroflexota bacterium]MQC27919.1 glutaredoxin family protein [Chloroflexota bacterium]